MLHINFFNTGKKTEVFYFFSYFLIVLIAIQCGLIVLQPVSQAVYEMLPSVSKLERWTIAEIVCTMLSMLLYQLIYRIFNKSRERKVAPGWTIVFFGYLYGATERQATWYDGRDPTNIDLILMVYLCSFLILIFISSEINTVDDD